ncbi:MAG: hypothetical protein NTX53_20235 [candidate division WOR-3 bacterium]|nr:hypothetical protein [candidate division WOR-3 bacterium]
MNLRADRELVLYRGDAIPPHVKASPRPDQELVSHMEAGLFARSFYGKTRSEVFDLTKQVPAHIGHEGDSEAQELYKHSPLISFSSSLRTAFSFMDGSERPKLVECHSLIEATHFVWELRLDERDLTKCFEPNEGCRRFCFKAGSKNMLRHFARLFEKEWMQEAEGGGCAGLLQALGACVSVANTDDRYHYAALIDAQTFVEKNCLGTRLYECARELAERHQEWLLCPLDAEGDPWPSGRFPMNPHLNLYGLFHEGEQVVP